MAEQPAAAATDELKNCFGCKKPMKKIKRYYRNGHFYCNKNCFKTKAQSAKAAPAEKEA